MLLDVISGCLPPSDFPFAEAKCNEALPGSKRVTDSKGQRLLITPEPRKNVMVESVLALSMLCSWFMPISLAPVLSALLLYYAAKLSLVAWTFICLMVALSFIPPGTEWDAYRQSKMWETWHRYFQVQYILPELPYLKPDKHYLFAQFPHGVYPMNAWLAMTFAGRQGSGSSGNLKGAIASIFFSLPLIKHNYAWVGCLSADKQSMLTALKHSSLACLPEGIAGIFEGASPSREAIYLQHRKGFVKVAIEAGVDIVPIYTLGQSQILTFRGSEKLSRMCRASIGLWWGWGGLPIPRPHKLITLVGAPIPVQQNDNPKKEEVEALHAKVVKAIADMYAEHRSLLGWEDRPLHIV
ncbi:hypothetical protein WJX73_010719 [Symbiochloris irregularis]|uniref:Acyltransferase n=1 Tax=Symbiochloris irregularis TaxID=706552 RepID=A0AAW1PF46_9CHLO